MKVLRTEEGPAIASPFYFLYSIFCLHAMVIGTLKRFPWHVNLTGIFSAAVDYFC